MIWAYFRFVWVEMRSDIQKTMSKMNACISILLYSIFAKTPVPSAKCVAKFSRLKVANYRKFSSQKL